MKLSDCIPRPGKYGVWCVVSGGITGHREAWLKSGGRRAEFDSRDEAAAEAAKWNQKMNGPYATAAFSYRAVELT